MSPSSIHAYGLLHQLSSSRSSIKCICSTHIEKTVCLTLCTNWNIKTIHKHPQWAHPQCWPYVCVLHGSVKSTFENIHPECVKWNSGQVSGRNEDHCRESFCLWECIYFFVQQNVDSNMNTIGVSFCSGGLRTGSWNLGKNHQFC